MQELEPIITSLNLLYSQKSDLFPIRQRFQAHPSQQTLIQVFSGRVRRSQIESILFDLTEVFPNTPIVGTTKPQQRDMWVTVVPELKNFCTNYSATTGKEVTPRIEQLLGLPPGNNEPRKIVEFWVSAKDLFRLTPGPEISAREAELEFRPANEFLSVSDKYKDWYNHELSSFNSRMKEMNPDSPPAPWTRLGYTYDWGDSADHVGLSEFVLAKGSSLEVDAVTPIDDYCQGDDAIAMMNLTK